MHKQGHVLVDGLKVLAVVLQPSTRLQVCLHLLHDAMFLIHDVWHKVLKVAAGQQLKLFP